MEKLGNTLEKGKSQLPDENKTAGSQVAAGPESPNALNGSSPVYRESRPVRLNLNTVRDNRCMCMFPDSAEIEYFKVLRTQIQQRTREKGWNTLMVTSALPGEGKTLTAVNLALTFAREYHQTVLLVDCDFRWQRVNRYLGLESRIGLIDYLLDDKPLKDLIVWPGIDKLTLITGGRKVLDTTEILNSRRMRKLVREMKERYDDRLILFDLPPVLAGADAISFADLVEGIVLVVNCGVTALSDIKRSVDRLPREKILGFVLNRGKSELFNESVR